MSQLTIVSSWPMWVPTSGISYKHERYHSPGTSDFYRTLGFRRINEVHTTINNITLERLRSTPFHRRHALVGVLYAPPPLSKHSTVARVVCCTVRRTEYTGLIVFRIGCSVRCGSAPHVKTVSKCRSCHCRSARLMNSSSSNRNSPTVARSDDVH